MTTSGKTASWPRLEGCNHVPRMRERLHAIAGKQTLAEQHDDAVAPVVGKRTLTERLGEGESLPYELQAKFGKSLGRDLSSVRVHTSPKASLLADKLGARAMTLGANIIFGVNEYKPHTDRGRSLIAHEVAHTAQQGHASAAAIEIAHRDEAQGGAAVELVSGPTELTKASAAAESNADSAAAAMLAGLKAMVTPQPVAIARKGKDEAIDDHPIDTKATTEGASHDETIGELTADRVGEQPDESNGTQLVEKPDTQSGKQGLADIGGKLQGDVHAMPAGGDAPPHADAGGGGGGGAGGEGGGELGASVAEAQREAREGAAAAEGEASAFKAGMKTKQDTFDAEQQALVLAQLKTMSAKDKRSTLADLGYDPKAIKKLKDSELDDLITGKLEAENRKGKILGMEPDELAKLSSAQKLQFLCDLGIDRKDLEKAGTVKCDALFADIIKASKVPGQQKVKVQIKGGLFGKSWVVTVKVDDAGVDISAKKDGGFLSKLVGWVKAALPIVLTVLAPITGGASLIALSVYQTVVAIKTGNWLGAIVGAAGAFAGLGALKAIKNSVSGLATAFQKIGAIADKVKTAAGAAQAAMLAAKAKNPGSLLAALASGAATFATFAGNAAGKFATTMKTWSARLNKWSAIATGGQKVIAGIKDGDAIAAISGAFETAGAVAGGKTGKDLQRASTITTYVNSGRRALQANPPDYAAVADAALGIAGQLHQDRRIDDAQRIVQRANALRVAWSKRNADPAALAQAALALAEGIQLAKYDLEHDGKKDADGKPAEDKDRDAIVARYQRNTQIVASAGAALRAVTTRPPNYTAALAAFTQLAAELTEDKRIDAASELTAKMDRWTQAVRSGDERAILDAGIAFGEAINGMRSSIEEHRNQAKQEAEKALPPGEKLPDGDGVATLPPGPNRADLLNAVPSGPKDKDPLEFDPGDPAEPRPTYSKDVETAQQMLNRLGYGLAIDGLLGDATRRALAAFQRSATPPLPATGRLDGATFECLLAATADSTVSAVDDTKVKAELALVQGDAGRLVAHARDSLRTIRNGNGAMAAYYGDQLEREMFKLEDALIDSKYGKTLADHRDAIGLLRADMTVVEHYLRLMLGFAEPNAAESEILAGGAEKLLWAGDITFKVFAERYPALAVAYGFLTRALPIAIHEHDLGKALLYGLSGAASMFLESRKIDKTKITEVIAKETAKALAENAPELIESLGAIRASSLGDFIRQAEPIVARFCEKVAASIVAKVMVRDIGNLPAADDVQKWMRKAVEDALKGDVKHVVQQLFDALEKHLSH